MPRDEVIGRLDGGATAAARSRPAPRRPRRSASRRAVGLGLHTRCTATTSTTSRSSSRGPTSSALRQADGDPFVADPRAARPGRVRGPGRGRSRPTSTALVRPLPPRPLGRRRSVTPGWDLTRPRRAPRRLGGGGRPGDRGVRRGAATGWPIRTRGSTPGTSGWSRRSRGDGHRGDARPLRRGRGPRCSRPSAACPSTTCARPTAGAGPTTASTATSASTSRCSARGARASSLTARSPLMATRADDTLAEPDRSRRSSRSTSPREFRLHPRDRVVAYTAEAAGARQLFTVVAARRAIRPS